MDGISYYGNQLCYKKFALYQYVGSLLSKRIVTFYIIQKRDFRLDGLSVSWAYIGPRTALVGLHILRCNNISKRCYNLGNYTGTPRKYLSAHPNPLRCGSDSRLHALLDIWVCVYNFHPGHAW